MQLYSYYRSSCSYRVRIALNLKQLAYEYKPINLLKAEHKELAFTKLNPLQQVPVLVDGPLVLNQSMAILMYLDQKHPQGHRLLPEAPDLRAQAMALCEVINAGTQPLQNLVLLNKLKSDFKASPEQIQKWNQYWIFKGLQAFEQLLNSVGPWALGAQPSVVDCVLVPQVYNALRYKVDLSTVPRIGALYQQALLHPAFQKAAPDKQPDAPTT